jgi:hypothetical protein
MERSIQKLILLTLLATFFACGVLVAESAAQEPNTPEQALPAPSRDFHIAVQTNGNVYHNRDVLRLMVKLYNNDVRPVFIGVCPVEPDEPNESEIEEVAVGSLDGADVEVAVMPRPPIVIGYATLTRLGPSPMPIPVLEAEEAPEVTLRPKKFRLPLFGDPTVPGHSTRIISVANILVAGPLLEVVPESTEGDEQVRDAESESVDIIPAVGRYVPLRPGYYLLNCYIGRICGTRTAQTQKIIHIKPRTSRTAQEPEQERR